MRKDLQSIDSKTIVSTDPTSNYEAPTEAIIEACGFVLGWVVAHEPTVSNMTLKEHLEACYGFGELHEMKGGEVTESGIYKYPEDPDMHPLVFITLEGGAEFLMWRHAICAMRDNQKQDWYVTRMD